MLSRFPKPRFLGVVLGTFLLTAGSLLCVHFVLMSFLKMDFNTPVVGIGFFFIAASLMLIFAFTLAIRFLYDEAEPAEFSIFGGARIGSLLRVISTGQSATWPFAKLLATKEKLWVHTPWGDLQWRKDELTLPIRRAFGLGSWRITLFHPEAGESVIFFTWPWQSNQMKTALEKLGYPIE